MFGGVGFNVIGTKHFKEKFNVNGLNSWENAATLDKLCLRSKDGNEALCARSQIICDQAESYGVTQKQVNWGKGSPPTLWPHTMVQWCFFSNPNQGHIHKEKFTIFKAKDVLRQC